MPDAEILWENSPYPTQKTYIFLVGNPFNLNFAVHIAK